MPAPRIQLFPTQQAFVESPALFRAFVGGIGCGKSRVGSYDMILRAKPGRLYMVVAPTYGMLADATLRSFADAAEAAGLVNPEDIKRSAPPAVRLRTGAEILFRSADDPDRLRGANLSGVWMDEASLMDLEAYTILIGRLREQGEQGWLSATFTPKGRLHWTYETFAAGRPNTAIFHARTADNPFLPKSFADTVRGQYTSATAAQELEGLFIDAGGMLFNRKWFGLVEPAAVPDLALGVRAWDLASTPDDDKKAKDPDWTAGVLMGRDKTKTLYVLDVKRDRLTPQGVQNLIRATAEADGKETPIVMEQEPGSAGVAMIDHYKRNVLQGYNFRGIKSSGDKATRAAPLAAQAESGIVKLRSGSWNQAFLDECEIFPLGKHDDQVDAASLALSYVADRGNGWGWKSPLQMLRDSKDPDKRPSEERLNELARKYGLRRPD